MLLKWFNIKMAFVAFVLLTSLRLFTFTLIPDRLFDYLELLSLFIIAVICLLGRGEKPNPEFSGYVNGIIFLTLLSSVSAYFYHSQGFLASLIASRTIFFWLFYYVLFKIEIEKEDLEKVVIFVGVLWALIMIYQQFSSHILFNAHKDAVDDIGDLILDEERGVKRIFIPGVEYEYFIVFYFLQKFYKKLNFIYLAFIGLALAAIFITGSRQVIFGVLAIIFFHFVFTFRIKNNKQFRLLLIFAAFSVGMMIVAGDYLYNLIALSGEQKISSGDYIRNKAIKFFVIDYNPSSLTYIIGNGWENFHSPYGHEIKSKIEGFLRYFRSDIGLIGALNKFGIIYVIFVLRIYYKMIFKRKKIYIPLYIRQFFIMCFITAFTGTNYFETNYVFLLFACLFYLIDKETKLLKAPLRNSEGTASRDFQSEYVPNSFK